MSTNSKQNRLKSVIDIDLSKYSKAEIQVLIEYVQRSSKFKKIVPGTVSLLRLFQSDAKGKIDDRFRKTREEALDRIEQEKELFNKFSEEWCSSNYGRAKLAGHNFWDWKQQKMIPFTE
jgi:hypothetical protein